MSAEPADRQASGGRRAAMPFILVTVVIDMISVGLILPVLPALVGSFTGSQADQAFWYGAVAFAFAFANFIGSPILGALSDRYGRRPVLLLGFCGLAVSFFATALATALWVLVFVRFIGGGMQANIAVAQAYVADITAPEDRARRFGLLGAMFGLGFILGPVAGGLLGAIDLHLPFYAAGTLALVNLLYGFFVLPESLPVERRRPFEWRNANPVSALKRLTALRGIGPLVVVMACSALAQMTLHTIWVLYTSFKFGWGPSENGWSLFAVGVASALVQGVLLRHLIKRVSPQKLVVAGLVSSALGYLLWGLASEGWMMYAVMLVNMLGFTIGVTLQGIVSNAADAKTQGQTLGALSSLNSLMAVAAPLVGAPLLALVSHLPQGDWRIGVPFFFCAALQAVALVFAIRHFARERLRASHALPTADAAP